MTRLVPLPILAGLALASTALPGPAMATPLSYGTGLANPAVTIDFSDLMEGATVGSTYAAQGVTFNGLYVTSQFGDTLSPTKAPAAANFNNTNTNKTFSLSFSSVMSDVAFFLDTDGFGVTITSTLNGATVESISAGRYATNGADFFGFTNSAFDGITLVVSGTTGSAVIDNVELGSIAAAAVPEPGTNSIIIVGLAGMMALRRRRI